MTRINPIEQTIVSLELAAGYAWSFTQSTGKYPNLHKHLETAVADYMAAVRRPKRLSAAQVQRVRRMRETPDTALQVMVFLQICISNAMRTMPDSEKYKPVRKRLNLANAVIAQIGNRIPQQDPADADRAHWLYDRLFGNEGGSPWTTASSTA